MGRPIELLDSRDPEPLEAITEVLARLLPVTMFVHYAREHLPGAEPS